VNATIVQQDKTEKLNVQNDKATATAAMREWRRKFEQQLKKVAPPTESSVTSEPNNLGSPSRRPWAQTIQARKGGPSYDELVARHATQNDSQTAPEDKEEQDMDTIVVKDDIPEKTDKVASPLASPSTSPSKREWRKQLDTAQSKKGGRVSYAELVAHHLASQTDDEEPSQDADDMVVHDTRPVDAAPKPPSEPVVQQPQTTDGPARGSPRKWKQRLDAVKSQPRVSFAEHVEVRRVELSEDLPPTPRSNAEEPASTPLSSQHIPTSNEMPKPEVTAVKEPQRPPVLISTPDLDTLVAQVSILKSKTAEVSTALAASQENASSQLLAVMSDLIAQRKTMDQQIELLYLSNEHIVWAYPLRHTKQLQTSEQNDIRRQAEDNARRRKLDNLKQRRLEHAAQLQQVHTNSTKVNVVHLYNDVI
jgi:hypothetical protein